MESRERPLRETARPLLELFYCERSAERMMGGEKERRARNVVSTKLTRVMITPTWILGARATVQSRTPTAVLRFD